ncbi:MULTISPECIES: hypothetical protein [unclassified Streptomyces]|uniref:DUF6630 family protein n=1 Tax=unclassified Streptomyces TaxID=2593676 RepID=UPI0016609D8C|nr:MULTISPECIES: hypothetical protein [unclassified Streptomyces]MBD0709559.1 hypothetical protein [Streptomyces sp. CBMA291]MBD0715278.1 hypothetical protein [Streptomyces sp. CBMA370]MBD0717880.1 hypothetical protein [Streptomyces sp. CBMA370]
MTNPEALVLTAGERAREVPVGRVVFTMDWTGEEEPGDLAEFVAGRLRAFGTEPTGVDTDGVRRAAESDPTPARGDLPVRQLDHLAEVLAGLGHTLAVWETGTDAYEILVLPTGEDELPDPGGLSHEGFPIRPWGAASAGNLIGLDCPHCSTPQIWDPPPGETLADERCDCGTVLFDSTGQPLPHVTVHG